MYIALSPAYSIRNEAEASFLIRVDKIIDKRKSDFGAFCIPPFMGYILAHIGDFEYNDSIRTLSKALMVSPSSIEYFVNQLIGNKENKEFKISETQSVVLPHELLKQYPEHPRPIVFEDKSFNRFGNYVIKRPSVPINANFMVTTACSTDCLYCYANRKLQPVLKTDRILDLIRELHDQGTINVTLTGGDIFAHPDWRLILKSVRQYGYKPFLSTKTPLDFEQVKYLRDLGYEEMQFSLDSADIEILKPLIKVKDNYLDRVSSFLEYCSELNLNVLVRSVLTKNNASDKKILSLYNFLYGFSCIKEWVMTPAFFSKYKEAEYKSLEVDNDDLIWVYKFTKREDLAFRIGLNKITKDGYVLKQHNTTEEFVCHNQICMGNTTGISILANGNCSVCEMLYDNPEFLLGNVSESSISDIWNSEKAMSLYRMSQQLFPNSSPCRECRVFEKCRNDFGKRVCYLDIAKSGYSGFYPDPRCPHAENVELVL